MDRRTNILLACLLFMAGMVYGQDSDRGGLTGTAFTKQLMRTTNASQARGLLGVAETNAGFNTDQFDTTGAVSLKDNLTFTNMQVKQMAINVSPAEYFIVGNSWEAGNTDFGLTNAWPKRFTNNLVTNWAVFKSYAVNGASVSNVLGQLTTNVLPYLTAGAGTNRFVFYGTGAENDCFSASTTTNYGANITVVSNGVKMIVTNGATVFLRTLPQYPDLSAGASENWRVNFNEGVRSIVASYRAQGYKIALIDVDRNGDVEDRSMYYDGEWIKDGLHPSEKASEGWAGAYYEAYTSLLFGRVPTSLEDKRWQAANTNLYDWSKVATGAVASASFANSSSLALSNLTAAIFPVGGVMPFYNLVAEPNLIYWSPCNGSNVANASSALNGVATPNLNSNRWSILTNTQPLVYAGGLQNFTNTSQNWDGSSGPWTVLNWTNTTRIKQAGTLFAVSAYVNAQTNHIKFGIYRLTGTNYYCLGQTEWVTNATAGSNYFAFVQPVFNVREGDYLGIVLTNGGVVNWADDSAPAGAKIQIVAGGDIATGQTNAFFNLSHGIVCMKAYMNAPVAAFAGDSIMEGLNGWHGFENTDGPTGDPTHCIPYQFYAQVTKMAGYKNYSLQSQTLNWVDQTAVAQAVADKALKLIVAGGINDILTSRTWASALTNLNSIRTKWPTTNQLFICEILPRTAGNDTEAGTIRTWNANLRTWALTNNATIIPTHDRMGKVRVSTGYYDDLATAYDDDGTHLSQAGIGAFAAILVEYTVEPGAAVYYMRTQ